MLPPVCPMLARRNFADQPLVSELSFAPAAPCRGVEIAGFVLNPMDESGHFRMFAQRLWTGVMSCQLGFGEQGMNLLVTRAVHKDRDNATP